MKRLKGMMTFGIFTLMPMGAYAAGVGGLGKFESFIVTVCTWGQNIGLVLAGGAFVWAGIKFLSAEPNENPWKKAKNAGIGTAMIAGASIIVSFIKGAIM